MRTPDAFAADDASSSLSDVSKRELGIRRSPPVSESGDRFDATIARFAPIARFALRENEAFN